MRASVLVLLLGLVLMVSVSNGYVRERKDDPSVVLNEVRAEALRDYCHTRTPDVPTRGGSAAKAVYDSSFWDTRCPTIELHGRKLCTAVLSFVHSLGGASVVATNHRWG
ncbi:hypothetical protein LSAT2_010601 [Lamellibrachia satsuma]|nr:hypothetical protein LSAT2_010601 [Lamellibrachia satsuma]